jgi:hypothetical protein
MDLLLSTIQYVLHCVVRRLDLEAKGKYSFILQALVGSVCEVSGNRDLGGYLPSGIIFSVLFHPIYAYYCPEVLMFPSHLSVQGICYVSMHVHHLFFTVILYSKI